MMALALAAPATGAETPPPPDDFARDLAPLAAATHPRPGMHLVATVRAPLLRARAGDDAIGTLLPGVDVVVLASRGKRLRVRVDGWQQEPGARAVYARRGVRMLSLILTQEAARHVAASGTDWRAVRVTGWLDGSGLVAARERLWQAVARLDGASCGGCHAVKPPATLTVARWAGMMSTGRHRTMLDEDRAALLLRWLQMGASDAGS
jgi:hypothetical protein